MRRVAAIAIALAAAGAAMPALANVTHLVQDLAYSGGTERALLISPDRPKAAVILLVGGDGVIKLGPDGTIGEATNFLAHTRDHWATKNIAVVLPDVPEGMGTLLGRRQNAGYGAAVAALVDFAKSRSNVPVFLVGNSQGTNGVVSAASRLPAGAIAGIVLTSTITQAQRQGDLKETVFDADLSAIAVPALIIADSDDRCPLSPPGDGPRIQAALSHSPKVKLVTVGGGEPTASAACDTTSGHGFFGLENTVVNKIANWIEATIRGG
jgi:pimeloyl-ACP methyl ester carboxylesterase